MQWITEAFRRKWFYVGSLIMGVAYGLGAIVHIGNILGFGEVKWTESPLSWKVGDICWGALDVVAVVGIVLKSPIGVLALVLAACSQIIAYSFFPDSFATTEPHRSTLRGLIYFNGIVLVVMVVAVYLAARTNDT